MAHANGTCSMLILVMVVLFMATGSEAFVSHFDQVAQSGNTDSLKATPACVDAVTKLSKNPAYISAYLQIMGNVERVLKSSAAACAMSSIECELPDKDSGAPVKAKCCGTNALSMWQPQMNTVGKLVEEGMKDFTYPNGGLVWLGLGLEVHGDDGNLYGMGFSNALPLFFPASCFNDGDVTTALEQLNAGCMKSPEVVACSYNLLQPTP